MFIFCALYAHISQKITTFASDVLIRQSKNQLDMNKKLLSVLSVKCKDMGLTPKAIEDLATAGSEGLTDDSSDEDIETKATSLIPFAKSMQAEITRKAQKKQPKTESEPDDEGNGGKKDENEPDWFKAYREKNEAELKAIKDENANFKAEKAKGERYAQISAKAKELGIPDYLMKRFHVADDADFENELTEYKQDLVTNNLMPADAGGEKGNSDQVVKEDAKTWANSLPNN